MPRKRTTRREKGDGYYWFDAATRQHRWRIRKDKQVYIVSDRDSTRAKEKFLALKQRLNAGVQVTEGKQTVETFARRYLETTLRVGESTMHDYAKRIGYYILPWLGDYPLDSLTTAIGEAWVAAMVREPFAVSSITQALRLAQRILDRAVSEKLIAYNPFAIIKPPRAAQRDDTDEEDGTKALTVEQEQRFLDDARAHDKHWTPTTGKSGRTVRAAGLYALYTLAFRLGLRRGELLGLRRKDIDFEQKIIRIRQQVIRLGNTHRVSKTLKTPAARRELPLTDDVAAVLRPHVLRVGAVDEDLLFTDRHGQPCDPNALTRHFSRACKRLGMRGFNLHDTRATAISRWREQRMQAEVVAALAGHETAAVSLETYSQVSMERKRKALGG